MTLLSSTRVSSIDFARDRFFEALAGLDEAGEGRMHALRPGCLPAEEAALVALMHQHDHRRIGAREMHRVAGFVGAAADMAGFFRARRAAAHAAKAMALMPVGHAAREGEQRAHARAAAADRHGADR